MSDDIFLEEAPERKVESDLIQVLYKMIDKKFNRTDRTKKINPILLKSAITLYAISAEFLDQEPGLIVALLKKLVKEKRISSNIDDEGVYPFGAYFIPAGELVDEKSYDIYLKMKNQLL